MKILHVVVLSLSACTVALSIDQQSTASPSGAESAWQAMTRADTEFMADWAKREHILAVYPDSHRFDVMLSAAKKQADSDLKAVRNFTGYRQALNHFTSIFNDAHFSTQMTVAQDVVRWPGFLAAYRGGHYEVYGGDGAIAEGQIITACDGQSLDIWVERLAPFESIVPALESTRARTAPLVLRDVDSPFVPRPKVCTIGGYDVPLSWETMDAGKFASLRSQLIGQPDPVDRVEPFGDDGVWITLNNIAPNTAEHVEAFNAVVRKLPEWRSKRLIVIDERNNGGGPYNWFMAFLRSLYGVTYTDYYARERLKIENVYRTTPEIRTLFSGAGSVRSFTGLQPPADGVELGLMESYNEAMIKSRFVHTPANDRAIAKPASPGSDLVHAKVVVVTGYGCLSACIGFVDELKKIPGVVQVGTETGVDSRPGTPFSAPLPSGNGSIRVPVMTRDSRPRGDNVPQKPAIIFSGDIQDTRAVKAWVAEVFAMNQSS